MKFEAVEAVRGLPNAKVTVDNREAVLHSRDPEKEAERIFSRLNPALEWTVVCGFGLGYLVEFILRNPAARVIVYEHRPEILDYAASVRNASAILHDPRVRVFDSPNALISFLEDNRIRELNFTVSRPYHTLFPEVYSSVEGMLAAHLSRRQINDATIRRFQKVWLRNIVKNAPSYVTTPGISHIRHAFAGRPAVVVGAGPSLAKNVALLKDAAPGLLVIATDTALPMLQYHGVPVDFVVSVDPQNKNTLFLLYSDGGKVRLVLEGSSSFITLSKFRAAGTFLTDSVFPVYGILQNHFAPKGSLAAGGSVSTTAFDLARYFACDPILLVGQDLAFSGKQTHAPGNVLEDFLYSRIDRFHTYDNYNTRSLLFSDKFAVDGWNGGKVQTDRKFTTFLEWFVREIAVTRARVVNATEGGACIPGAEHIPLAEALAKYCPAPFDKDFTVDYQGEDRSPLDRLMTELAQLCASWLPAARDAQNAARRSLALFREEKDIRPQFQFMSRFDDLIAGSVRRETPISRFIEFVMQDSIRAIVDSPVNGELTEDDVARWVSIYSEACDALLSLARLTDKYEKLVRTA